MMSQVSERNMGLHEEAITSTRVFDVLVCPVLAENVLNNCFASRYWRWINWVVRFRQCVFKVGNHFHRFEYAKDHTTLTNNYSASERTLCSFSLCS